MSGYYSMPRGWMDRSALGGDKEPLCKKAAWIWLVEEARWAAGTKSILGKTVKVERGQVAHAYRFIAKAWNWPEAKVRRFLQRISQDNMIRVNTDAGSAVITICNYDTFAENNNVDDAQLTQDRRKSDARVTQTRTKGKREEGNKKESKSTPLPPSRSLLDVLPLNVEKDVPPSRPVVEIPAAPRKPAIPPDHQTVLDAWNAMATENGLDRASTIAGARAGHLNARLREHGLAGMLKAIQMIADSDFCCARLPGSTGWKACFDMLLDPGKCDRALNGTYANRKPTPRANIRISEHTGREIMMPAGMF